jgi:hypothetical protein
MFISQSKTLSVTLDKPRRIRFDETAIDRLAALPGGLAAALDSERIEVNVVNLLFAMLVDREGVTGPADVAELMPEDPRQKLEVWRGVDNAIKAFAAGRTVRRGGLFGRGGPFGRSPEPPHRRR